MRVRAILLCFLVATVSLSGCFGAEEVEIEEEVVIVEDQRTFVTDKYLSLIHISEPTRRS